MSNELLEKWAEACTPWFERERGWWWDTPPEEAVELVGTMRAVGTPRESVDAMTNAIKARHELVTSHSWAVPTEEALDAIARHSPNGVVEIGAGTGYWAGLLRERGVNVVAYDVAPHDNAQAKAKWSEVEVGNHLNVLKHRDRSLMLCWPPYSTDMASMALRRYHGNVVIYIGESAGGCNADEAFHEMLESWKEIERIGLPQWPGINDRLVVYYRSSQP